MLIHFKGIYKEFISTEQIKLKERIAVRSLRAFDVNSELEY